MAYDCEQSSQMNTREAILDRMRLIIAGLFVVAGLCGGFALLFPVLQSYPVWLAAMILVAVLFGFVAVALCIFNGRHGGRDAGGSTLLHWMMAKFSF